MAIYSIYRLTNTVNGKVYIGQTKTDPTTRFNNHKVSAQNGSQYAIHRAMRKYGIDSFLFEVICNALTESDMPILETQLIIQYDCCTLDGLDKGYNMTRGGDGVDSERAKQNVLKRIADNTHPWVGSSHNLSRVAANTHPFQGDRGKAVRQKMKEDGTWDEMIEKTKARHTQQLAAGTHYSQQELECPHCFKVGYGIAMNRWHFDNCKSIK